MVGPAAAAGQVQGVHPQLGDALLHCQVGSCPANIIVVTGCHCRRKQAVAHMTPPRNSQNSTHSTTTEATWLEPAQLHPDTHVQHTHLHQSSRTLVGEIPASAALLRAASCCLRAASSPAWEAE